MLFKQNILQGIEAGEITLAFRQWRRPTVKSGGTLITSVGQLHIVAVDIIASKSIKPRDAAKAGFKSLEELLSDLDHQRPGDLYRISFELAGPDPRSELRLRSLTDAEFQNLRARLQSLDNRSSIGPWTLKVLQMIAKHPKRSAGELAADSDYEKEWLKQNVRKLKNLGLTESLNPGYQLSPRGKDYLQRVANRNSS